jgi:hypothetical protein
MKCEFFRQIFGNSQTQVSSKVGVQWELSCFMRTDERTDRRTDGQTDMNLIVTFRNSANAPKMYQRK